MNKNARSGLSWPIAIACLMFAVLGGVYALSLEKKDAQAYLRDPIVEREIKRAKRLGKEGKWKQAAALLADAAKTQNPSMMLEYALLFTRGWGVKRDLERARILLLQSVQYEFPGRGRAAFELGRIYRKSRGKDCSRIAFEWYSKALQWDYYKAHAELGKAYARGLGVDMDLDRALFHYKAAARYGSAAAVVPLISLIARGSSTTKPDIEKAKRVLAEFMPTLEADASSGNAFAARTLGRLYSKNNLVRTDKKIAFRWFSMAATLGDAAAMHDLALLTLENGDATNHQQAVLDLLTESADRNYAAAMTALGRLHLTRQLGLHPAGAVAWFEKGVIAGHPGSMEELAKLYIDGELVAQNFSEALQLAEHGARLNHKGSKAFLEKLKAMAADSQANISQDNHENRG